MKKSTFLMTALMSSTILGTTVVNAAENTGPLKLDTNATVSFVAEDEKAVDPENPLEPEIPGGGETVDPIDPTDPENPGGETPETTGPLMIEFAPNFDFGQDHEIKAADMAFEAKNKIKKEDGTFANHFVQVKDTRGGSKGWNVTVTATALTNGTDNLDATTIDIAGANAIGLANATLAGDVDFKQIAFGGEEISVMSAAKGEGGGRWWKSLATTVSTADVTNKDVVLNIPAADAAKISEDEYNSTLTWEIAGLTADALSATPQSK